MPGWLGKSLLVLGVLGACWGGAMWYWQASNRVPSGTDLVLYLAVLPLAVLLVLWLGRLGILAISAPAVAVAPAQAAQPPAPPPAAAPPFAIAAAALRCAHGASAEELAGALAEQRARPELDPDLVDDYGFPIMSARCPDADDDARREEISAWLEEQAIADPQWNDEQWRTLLLATAVTYELAGHAMAELPPERSLQLLPVFPQGWKSDQQRAAGQWLRQAVADTGWPGERIVLAAPLPGDLRGTDPAAILARLAFQATSSGAPLAAMLIGAGSLIGEGSVNQLSANGKLFTNTNPQGQIPGEGAAGLLLLDAAHAKGDLARLHTPAQAQRSELADDARRADAGVLRDLSARIMRECAVDAATVAKVVADSDHRTSRIMELMDLASHGLAHLDVAEDVLRVGMASGSCGPVQFMSAIVVAHHHALEQAKPVLCISNDHSQQRCAVLLRPPAG